MDQATLKKAEEIFQVVVDLPAEQRAPVLADRCAGQANLREFVERLLANHEAGMGTFMRAPVFTPPPATKV